MTERKSKTSHGHQTKTDLTAVWPVRVEGLGLARSLGQALGAEVLEPWSFEGRQKDHFASAFGKYSAIIVVGTTGIAVRFIDGLMVDKKTDPAVVVVDEAARFAVSLLSGHEGGANDLAYRAASIIGAFPVVTTATETHKPIVVGIGCRRGVPSETIREAVAAALAQCGASFGDIRHVATIDLKKDEPGLLEFCQSFDLPLHVLGAADLAARPFVTKASSWVKEITGADGVCEPAALVSSLRGRLILPKFVLNGVTVAVVADENFVHSLSALPEEAL